MNKSHISLKIIRVTAIFILLSALSLGVFSSGAVAEKIPVALTIKAVPDAPALDRGFHLTGTLSTASGELLGNKRVVLESSQVNPSEPGTFSYIATSVTSRVGEYDFFRPKYSPPEYLRVGYAGNDLYEPAISPVLPIRGVGTDNPQRLQGNGSLMLYTDPIGASIFIDSEFRGTTPTVLQELKEGAHLVELSLEGYQNETMEAYISPTRGSSFSITMTPTGLERSSTGLEPDLSSSISFAENDSSILFGEPVFSFGDSIVSTKMYANTSSDPNSTRKDVQVTTVVSNNTAVGDGYDIMVIMTDH